MITTSRIGEIPDILKDGKLNYENIYRNIVEGMKEYLTTYNIECMIIGISGGIDSTVSAAICKTVSHDTEIPLIGVSLPCSTNKEDEITSANLTGHEFCDRFQVISIQEPFEAMEKFCEHSSQSCSTPISQGNIKARLRMITLYDMASKKNGIVIGTSNKTEWMTGFWTLHGDVGDINPIGELWKTEVYSLATYLKDEVFKESKALDAAISITPTDGNGVKNGGDAEQIMPGYTYNEIDHVLKIWCNLSDKIKAVYASDGLTDSIKNTVFGPENEDTKARRKETCLKSGKIFMPTLGDMYGVDSVRAVCMRSWVSEYKRKNLEACINIKDGSVFLH